MQFFPFLAQSKAAACYALRLSLLAEKVQMEEQDKARVIHVSPRFRTHGVETCRKTPSAFRRELKEGRVASGSSERCLAALSRCHRAEGIDAGVGRDQFGQGHQAALRYAEHMVAHDQHHHHLSRGNIEELESRQAQSVQARPGTWLHRKSFKKRSPCAGAREAAALLAVHLRLALLAW